MKEIDWTKEAGTATTGGTYYAPPGEYTAEILDMTENKDYSTVEKPQLNLKLRLEQEIDGQTIVLYETLRFYGGSLPWAAAKLKGIGVNMSELSKILNTAEIIQKTLDAAEDNLFTINVTDRVNNNGKTVTNINSIQKLEE